MDKIKLSYGLFLVFFIAIITKLFYIQVIKPSNSANNYYLQTKKISAARGKIFDRNSLPMAVNRTNYLLFAEPKKINDKEKIIEALDEILDIGVTTLSGKINSQKEWVAIGTVDEQQKKNILEKHLDGIDFEEKSQRYYPESSLSAHLLGFVGRDYQGENIGYFGIEGYYNKDLTGLSGVMKTERDILNRPILIGTQEKVEPQNGRDFYLTVDKTIQEIVKRKLNDGLSRYRALKGCVIIADPATMKIAALSCLPDFDVEKYYLFSDNNYKNTSISDLYEPGSIFKPLIMAAAIEQKTIKPNDIYDEKGPITVDKYQINTWNNKYEGKITMTRILEKSSNVGMVYIGQKLGKDNFYRYLKDYGFGEPTEIDLQGEVTGYLRPKNTWSTIDITTVSFGQGIAVTSIQMLRAFAAIINGGNLMKPMVTERIVSGEKKEYIKPYLEKKIVSEQTSKIIRQMLYSTVENGDSKWAAPKGYKIGGKTGTAQIPIAGHYDPTKTVASFVGFAPVDNPKFIAIINLWEPKSSPWGSETAAPLFFDIAKELLVYYNIAPGQ